MFHRNTSLTNFTEPVEELTIVGYSEEPEIGTLFESTGHYYVHQSCAVWSSNTQDITTEVLSPAIVQASSRRCAYCSHYGAGIPCKVRAFISISSSSRYLSYKRNCILKQYIIVILFLKTGGIVQSLFSFTVRCSVKLFPRYKKLVPFLQSAFGASSTFV